MSDYFKYYKPPFLLHALKLCSVYVVFNLIFEFLYNIPRFIPSHSEIYLLYGIIIIALYILSYICMSLAPYLLLLGYSNKPITLIKESYSRMLRNVRDYVILTFTLFWKRIVSYAVSIPMYFFMLIILGIEFAGTLSLVIRSLWHDFITGSSSLILILSLPMTLLEPLFFVYFAIISIGIFLIAIAFYVSAAYPLFVITGYVNSLLPQNEIISVEPKELSHFIDASELDALLKKAK